MQEVNLALELRIPLIFFFNSSHHQKQSDGSLLDEYRNMVDFTAQTLIEGHFYFCGRGPGKVNSELYIL